MWASLLECGLLRSINPVTDSEIQHDYCSLVSELVKESIKEIDQYKVQTMAQKRDPLLKLAINKLNCKQPFFLFCDVIHCWVILESATLSIRKGNNTECLTRAFAYYYWRVSLLCHKFFLLSYYSNINYREEHADILKYVHHSVGYMY